ncbi:MAG: cupin domain-containing protein [Planctomycetota bacterium]|jgi:predicted cupin superfamily sugar epimerase
MPDRPSQGRELIEARGLMAHPEGGYYREVHHSSMSVSHPSREVTTPRPASTMIEFLLLAGEPSRWHRVRTEEIWIHLAGAPLTHERVDEGLREHQGTTLGPVQGGSRSHLLIPGGYWQAAHTSGEFTLSACIVAPGFEFEDFTLLRDEPELVVRFRERFPERSELL